MGLLPPQKPEDMIRDSEECQINLAVWAKSNRTEIWHQLNHLRWPCVTPMSPHTLFHPSLYSASHLFFFFKVISQRDARWVAIRVYRHRDTLSPSQEAPETICFIQASLPFCRVSLGAQLVKNLPAMQETLVWFLCRKMPWRRDRLPTPVFWPGEFHGLYSPWGCKESDTTEQLSL